MNFPVIADAQDFDCHFQSEIWRSVAEIICARHRISCQSLERLQNCEHIVFLVDDRCVIKIYKPFRNGFRRERAAIEFVQGKTSLPLPRILFEGTIENYDYLVCNQFAGVLRTREIWLGLGTRRQIEVVSELAAGLKELHSHNSGEIDFDWRKFIERQIADVFARQKSCGVNEKILERLPAYLKESLSLLPLDFAPVFLHGDVHFGNLRLIETNDHWRISGLFDFADSLKGFHEYDFLAVGVLMIQGQGCLQREFFRAYGYSETDINETLRRRLMLLTIPYECSDLRKYALRLKSEAVDYTLDAPERAIWSFA